MQPNTAKYLHDAHQACLLLEEFTLGKSFADYSADALLRSGVERQFTIVGEALLQAEKTEPSLAQAVSALRKIIGFRNVLVHGYGAVDHQTVWSILENDLALLKQQLAALLLATFPP